MDYVKLVGRNLRRIREGRALSQREVADSARALNAGWTQSTVARTEAGKRQLTLGELVVLAAVLDLALTDLVNALLVDPMEEVTFSGLRLGVSDVEHLASGLRLGEIASKRLKKSASNVDVASAALVDRTVARSLKWSQKKVTETAQLRWRRRLIEERDRRLRPRQGESTRSRGVRAGHITRGLARELAEFRARRGPRKGKGPT